jgi:hypothetical protein
MKNLHGTNWIGSTARLSMVSWCLRSRVVTNPRQLTAAAHQDAVAAERRSHAMSGAKTPLPMLPREHAPPLVPAKLR